jgi:ribosomal protein L34
LVSFLGVLTASVFRFAHSSWNDPMGVVKSKSGVLKRMSQRHGRKVIARCQMQARNTPT